MATTSSTWLTNWLRFLSARVKPPRRPEPMDDSFRDYTFSTQGDVAAALTPEDLQGILSQAADGYCDAQARLIQEMQEKEPVIAAHLATRKNAITGKPWTVTSEAQPETAAVIEAILRNAGLTEALGHLADFVPTGYAGSLVDWAPGGQAVRGFVQVAPEVFEFDLGGNVALRDKLGKARPLAEFHPAQFLTVLSNAKPGLPCRNGLGRALVWLYLFKHSGLAGFARYIERYGVPFQVATLPASQWSDRTAILATLKTLGRDGVAVKKEGTLLELLHGANASATDAQERFLRYCDEIFTITILGQLATSADAGGLSKGQAQENVRQDLLAADCQILMNAVQRGLIVPLCQMGYGMADAGDIVFDIEYQPSDDLDALAARWKILTEVTGKHIDAGAVEEQFGVKFGADIPVAAFGQAQPGQTPAGEATQRGAAGVTGTNVEEIEFEKETDPKEAPTGLTDPGSRALAAFYDREVVRALELVVEDALRQTTTDEEAIQAWIGPVQQALRETFGDLALTDVAEFKRRLPAFMLSLPRLLGKMDSSGFEAALSGAMLAGMVNGYTQQA